MKIAITQREITIRGIAYDCLERGWYDLLVNHEVLPVPNDREYNMSDVDCLIISGGENTEAREFTETQCYSDAVQKGIPVIGVCHGAFVLNRWHGGCISKIDQHQGTEHTVTLEGAEYTVNSYHGVCVDTLGNDLIPIAYAADHIEAFKHKHLPVWGIIWHPERMTTPVLPKELKELLFG